MCSDTPVRYLFVLILKSFIDILLQTSTCHVFSVYPIKLALPWRLYFFNLQWNIEYNTNVHYYIFCIENILFDVPFDLKGKYNISLLVSKYEYDRRKSHPFRMYAWSFSHRSTSGYYFLSLKVPIDGSTCISVYFVYMMKHQCKEYIQPSLPDTRT